MTNVDGRSYVPRPVNAAEKLTPALADPAPSRTLPVPPLSEEEEVERRGLREQLRALRSVGRVAQAWYGGLAALILTGLFARGVHMLDARWVLIATGAAAGFAWGFAVNRGLAALRLGRTEGTKLRRLEALDARAPKPPELF